MRALKVLCLANLIAFSAFLNAQQTTPATSSPGPVAQTLPAPANNPADRTADGLVRVSGGVMAAHIISKTTPDYPHTDAEGRVILLAIIGTDGKVQKLSVISGPEPLQKAALDAVRHWRYQPFMLNGSPRTVETTITINFKR